LQASASQSGALARLVSRVEQVARTAGNEWAEKGSETDNGSAKDGNLLHEPRLFLTLPPFLFVFPRFRFSNLSSFKKNRSEVSRNTRRGEETGQNRSLPKARCISACCSCFRFMKPSSTPKNPETALINLTPLACGGEDGIAYTENFKARWRTHKRSSYRRRCWCRMLGRQARDHVVWL
jgi:hypothetical protein